MMAPLKEHGHDFDQNFFFSFFKVYNALIGAFVIVNKNLSVKCQVISEIHC